jgi:hypothetical protein
MALLENIKQPPGEVFAAADDEISFQPATADAKNRTVDVVWYGGATVPRMDPVTGEPYMLRLDMAGCRMERLNAGAPVFDCHMSGLDLRSMVAGQVGSKAQRGSVAKAWADGAQGMATLQFGVEGENEDTDRLWSGIVSGRIRNLSFGTWVYSKAPAKDQNGNGTMAPHPSGSQAPVFVATDWEPFEVSAITVPADFSTQFLSAVGADAGRATSPMRETMEPTTQPGTEARNDQVVLDAARAEGARLERQRVSGITALGASFNMEKLATTLIASGISAEDARGRFATATEIRAIGKPMAKYGLTQEFVDAMIDSGVTLADARAKIQEELVALAGRTVDGGRHDTQEHIAITRDGGETRLACMQEAILFRIDPMLYRNETPAVQRQRAEMAREFVGFSLMEMAREALNAAGISTRGMSKDMIAQKALNYRRLPEFIGMSGSYFGGGAESTSDFPSILANVANKTLRQAYQAFPQTFRPFCRQTTAADFKPINRMALHDLAELAPLSESGEYRTATLTDSGVSYSLAEFGGIVRITRRSIINDDLQAFTRVSEQLGSAAAQRQSTTVWSVITGASAAKYAGDTVSTALFHANHKNLLTGTPGTSIDPTVGSANALMAVTKARAQMRVQKGPAGTHLNLVPRYVAVPAALEGYLLQLIFPINIASSDQTKVVPEWVRSLIPVVEPRLDDSSLTAWYLFADPAQIDTVEYCFLEGQEGVYFETKQGFEVDGVEMKARMDFGAAAIEYRGMQKNTGAA